MPSPRYRIVTVTLLLFLCATPSDAAERPNIILIGSEDISPNLGCYGDPDAITPQLDRFAAQGARFDRAFTHCPVCAPTRSGMITGQYPTTIGTHHMRSKLRKPPATYVEHLRKAGYFVAWPKKNGKTDFNFDVPKNWVDTTADWTRDPTVLPKDRPWFAYVNFAVTHESQARATAEQYAQNTQ
ncbi:MAG: sulfatase-like hydrolase/transferase, partial [Bacteroidales bacterium]|nr:sulfatase-like hydrolase/transferase [Bacteroidales bacterium]